jgi:hypothetical protein
MFEGTGGSDIHSEEQSSPPDACPLQNLRWRGVPDGNLDILEMPLEFGRKSGDCFIDETVERITVHGGICLQACRLPAGRQGRQGSVLRAPAGFWPAEWGWM